MHKTRKNRSNWFLALVFVIAIFGLSGVVHADTPTPAPVPAPAAVVPGSPGTPAPAPAPGQQIPQPAIPPKREDEPEAPIPSAPSNGPTPPARPSVFQRAAAYLQDRNGVASSIAQRDQAISELRQQLASRDQTITQLNSELAELRQGANQLEQQLATIEGQQRNVSDTLAGLGFPQQQLPGTSSLEQVAENTIEGQQAKLKDEQDPEKRSEIMHRIIQLRDGKK